MPKIAIARIERALADYRAVMTRDPLPTWEERAPVLTSTGDALMEILEPYRANIRQAGLTTQEVLDDIVDFYWDAGDASSAD